MLTHTRKILIIEDDYDMRLVYRQVLSRSEFEVVDTSDRGEALSKIIDGKFVPNCIFMDLTLPGLSAEDFMSKLRGRFTASEVPVVLLSGWPEVGEICKKIRAQDHLNKPVEFKSLLSTAKKWCDRSAPHISQIETTSIM